MFYDVMKAQPNGQSLSSYFSISGRLSGTEFIVSRYVRVDLRHAGQPHRQCTAVEVLERQCQAIGVKRQWRVQWFFGRSPHEV